MEESVLQTNLSYYPNPTKGTVTINLGEQYETVNVRVINVSGQLVSSSQYKNKQELNLDIVGVKGYYTVEIETESGQTASLRVLKQ